jgi:hypothetical protein
VRGQRLPSRENRFERRGPDARQRAAFCLLRVAWCRSLQSKRVGAIAGKTTFKRCSNLSGKSMCVKTLRNSYGYAVIPPPSSRRVLFVWFPSWVSGNTNSERGRRWGKRATGQNSRQRGEALRRVILSCENDRKRLHVLSNPPPSLSALFVLTPSQARVLRTANAGTTGQTDTRRCGSLPVISSR